jgi:DNA-directed RNA polymerase subunit D
MTSKINIKGKTKYNIDFDLDINDGDISLANTFRRNILSDVETYAFEEIDIKENTSIMNNDMLRHRIELIPIIYDLKENLDDIEFTFNIKGVENNYENFLSKDIKASNNKIYFNQKILIISLRENEKINFVAKLKKGKAKTHAKFDQICHMSYKFVEDEKKIKELKKTGDQKFFPNERQRNYKINKFNNPIVNFNIETNENIDISSYIKVVLNNLKSNLNFIKDSIINENKSKVEVNEYIPIKNTSDYIIHDESHSIGNLISNYCSLHKNTLTSAYTVNNNIKTFLTLRIISNGVMTSNKIFIETINSLNKNLDDFIKSF